ncbi:MAG: MG2 domain-containing protein [Candidatus Sumerlaeia bacterium]|nr:MG2 domain-containing protein [Candidatus Sumerlaeia bacterium]
MNHRLYPKRIPIKSAVAVLALFGALALGTARAVAAGAPAGAQSGESLLNIIGTVPLPDEPLRDQIILFFDSAIILPPLPDGRTTDPMRLTPDRPGQFRIGRNYVAFKAASPFAPRDIVRVEVHPNLQSPDGRKVAPNQRHLTFPTFALETTRIWAAAPNADPRVFHLDFPVPMVPDAVKQHVVVRLADGSPAPFQLTQRDSSKAWAVAVPRSVREPYSIVVTQGLADETGSLRLGRDIVSSYPPPAPPLSVIETVWTTVGDQQQEFQVRFSAPVRAQDLRQYLTVRNLTDGTTLPYTLQQPGTGNNHRARIAASDPERIRIAVEIARGLPAANKSVLQTAHTTRLFHDAEPLRVERHSWTVRGTDSPVLNLQFNRPIDLQQLKAHLEIRPEIGDVRITAGPQFQVYGNWRKDQLYQIRITAGLKYGKNRTLEKPLLVSSRTPKAQPHLTIQPPDKYYIPRSNEFALAVESQFVDRFHVTLHRMFPNNIAVAVSEIYGGQGYYGFSERWAEEIASKDVDLSDRRDQLVRTPLTADDLFPKNKKGVFFLRVASDQRWATKIVLLTEIGLLAHWQDDELLLFAHDLYTLEPRAGAAVTVYSDKNQTLGTGHTDAHGIAHLKGFIPARGEPRVVVVEHGDDYTFLELTPRGAEIGDTFDEARDAYNRKTYEAFLCADRELYRPGETAHLRWIVRQNYGDVPSGVPLLLTVTKPNGQKLLSEPTTLSRWGTGGLDLATQAAYPTGRYTVQLSVPGGQPIGFYSFNLEDFVPNRMKASVALPEPRWIAGREQTIRVSAQHLFGGAAAGRRSTANVVLSRTRWQPEHWKDYRFENDTQADLQPVPCGEQTTDASGTAVFRFRWTPPAQATFPLRATVTGEVFELGGRSVRATTATMLFPSEICLGIAARPVEGGKSVEVRVAAVNADETTAALETVQVTLERQRWSYYVRRYYDYYQSNWSDTFEKAETRDVVLKGGRGSVVFTPDEWGYYRVRVHSPKTRQFSTLTFYSYGTGCQVYESARPSLIKVSLDKPIYNIGDEVVARIESPFDGKAIVLVQGGEIHRAMTVELQNKVGHVRFTVGPEHFPNVWIEATVVHRIERGRAQVYPFSSFGAANVKVRERRRELKVAFLNLPKEIRPQTEAQIELETRNGEGDIIEAELTLAAVDEGIHSITDYANPDPLGWLVRSRRPDCRFAYYYDRVAYDFVKAAIGGDGHEAQMAKRLGAVGRNWIRPVALWSGTVRTGKDGRATVRLRVPEFNGRLRLVVVAASMRAVGANSASLLVRRPYILQTSLPRFLLPGDSARCNAVVYNHTDAPCKVTLRWEFGGIFREGAGSRELEIAPHGEAGCDVTLAAGNAVGQGEVRWEALIRDANGREVERLRETAPLPVRMPATYQSAHQLLVLKPAESKTFRNTTFRNDELAEITLTVGANNLLRLQKALEFVVGYPYGCLEQTTSQLLPMYLLRKAGGVAEMAAGEGTNLEEYLRAGIRRLFAMQTPSGGLAFWPGSMEDYPYGSIYALHFLTLVKNGRDFDLPAENLKALEAYVRGLALDWSDNTPPALYQRAYAVYVLALGGSLEALRQIERFDDVTLPTPARFLLAAALALNTKDHDRIALYLSKPAQPYNVREPDGTLMSDIRNTAVELMALRQIGGRPEAMAEKANRLLAFLENRHYGTTQETAFIITALADYLTAMGGKIEDAAARITAAGQTMEIRGPQTYRRTLKGRDAEFTVVNTGKTDLIVNVTMAGIPEQPDLAPQSKGVTLRRRFFTESQTETTATLFRQMRSYVIGLEITCEAPVRNLIVADLLPAGFEIENPRLNPDAFSGNAFGGAATPSHLEVRDDRLVLAFNALRKGTHRFYYIVHAVTPGTFAYPAVQGECMYDATISGRSAAARLEVQGTH